MEGKLNNIFFGLLGKNISYSFSKNYFSKKFINLKLNHHKYVNFDIENIEEQASLFRAILKQHKILTLEAIKDFIKEEIKK